MNLNIFKNLFQKRKKGFQQSYRLCDCGARPFDKNIHSKADFENVLTTIGYILYKANYKCPECEKTLWIIV